ncbi:MAG: hypothetical protein QM714_16110 [Nocardioides sp.]|uniref:hypothetical protein n=1 Tax=Nocardioides sp. TaxID=35761 RepID=UPI0039E28BF5
MTAETHNDDEHIALLTYASRQIPERSWVFTGFNWPMLAARAARRMGRRFTELYEAGAAVDQASEQLPSSTTDYASYADALAWHGTTLDVFGLIPRVSAVLLDASRVDVHGRLSTFGDGFSPGPRGRSAGGGGSADAAARAGNLILVHASARPDAITLDSTHPTAVPNPSATVHIVTRWGTLLVQPETQLLEVTDTQRGRAFASHLATLGVSVEGATMTVPPTQVEQEAAQAVLSEARSRGYRGAGHRGAP